MPSMSVASHGASATTYLASDDLVSGCSFSGNGYRSVRGGESSRSKLGTRPSRIRRFSTVIR